MSLDPITSLASIRSELEASWKLFDDVYATFGRREWSRKFGKTWTYAWQPYHLAFFDAFVAKYLAYGPDVPETERTLLRTMRGLSEWNEREFGKRPPTHTVEDSLAAMERSRDEVRRLVARMSDADLGRPVFLPIMLGWGTAADALKSIIVHNVAEYWKLWLRTGQRAAAPSPAAVHLRLGMMMALMPAMMNREEASGKPFTMVWHFDGPGGGMWTFRVADGRCVVTQTVAADADLTIRMKPEVFHQLTAKMTPAPLLMLTGRMKVKGFGAMGRFAKLFPEPAPDQIIEPPVLFGPSGVEAPALARS